MVGVTKNPPTLIQRPFAKAVSASDTTKLGKSEDMRTTRDSAARRSRKSHCEGRKLVGCFEESGG